jgi:hypothetical protein
MAVHPYSRNAASLAAHLIGVTGPQRDPRLRFGGCPQYALEDEASAVQPGRYAGHARHRGRLRPGREQAVPDIGHLGQHRIHHLLAEEVGVMELHHPAAIPPLAAVRSAVTIDDLNLVSAPRQRDRGIEPGWPGTNDEGSHLTPYGPLGKRPVAA